MWIVAVVITMGDVVAEEGAGLFVVRPELLAERRALRLPGTLGTLVGVGALVAVEVMGVAGAAAGVVGAVVRLTFVRVWVNSLDWFLDVAKSYAFKLWTFSLSSTWCFIVLWAWLN
jgi:hypothetical protein